MSNIKEPYSISVWEEELIPVQDWYVKGEERLTREEYEQLSETEREGYELHTVMEHYEETQGIIIGAHDMDSVYAAVNPILKKNVNGSVDLTFGLYYKVFDPDALDFQINPFTQLLINEAKVKLNFRGKWYDLIVKNCVEDSTNFIFNYTCKDIYVNELNKNGFKVELDTELENNQDVVTGLAETILLDTDWQVDKEGSQTIVETKIEPLYIGTLNQDITVARISDYTPDEYAEMEGQWEEDKQEIIIVSGSKVLFFYSDIAENIKNPQFLARIKPLGDGRYTTFEPDTEEDVVNYLTDANEDIVINSYNYQIVFPEVYYIDSDTDYNIPSVTVKKVEIYDYARGEKVIKSQLSGYDPDLDQFIFKFYKKDDLEELVEYYGYTKTEHLTSDLAQNYLANSDNFTSLQSGWYFDGIPAKTVKTRGKEKTAAYSGQIFSVSDPSMIGKDMKNGQESVLVLQLRNEEGNRTYYPDNQGEFYFVKDAKYEKLGTNASATYILSILNKYAEEYVKEYGGEKEDAYVIVYDEAYKEINQRKYSLIDDVYIQNSELADNGDGYIKVVDEVYVDVTSESAKAYENSIRAWVYDQRDYYVEGYADKTDEELDDIINETLLQNRYSYRSRYAVNNGVAANRQVIQNLTPGEQYLFAASLGKFTGANGPEYKRDVQYGGKVPTEFYEFSDSELHRDFIIKAVQQTLGEDKSKWADKYKQHQYYYHHPEYQNTYNKSYANRTAAAEKDYEDKFLFGLNTVNKEARDLWKSGGEKYRSEVFLEYLRLDKKTFEYEGQTVSFCEYLGDKLKEAKRKADNNETQDSPTKQLYDILIQRIKGSNNFTGIYPTMVKCTIEDAETIQKEPFRINANWEPMAYDDTMFPAFDEKQQDIVNMALSFNEHLFSAFYQGIKLALMTAEEDKTGEVNDIPVYRYSWNDKIELDTFVDDLETFLKTVYKATYEEGRPLDVYEKAKQYKMPGLGFPQGGEIYRAYKARWEAEAAEAAAQEAFDSVKSIEELFSMPACIDNIGNDIIGENNEDLDLCYDELIDLANFIQDKITAFKQNYSMEQIEKAAYNNALEKQYSVWVGEFLNARYEAKDATTHEHTSKLYGQYYYANFLPNFLEAWVSEQEIGTYVLAEDKYELNGTQLTEVRREEVEFNEEPKTSLTDKETGTLIPQLGVINSENKVKNPTAKHFVQGLYVTSLEGAYAAAYKTNYNPYLSTDEDEAGGYVFDRNEEVIRLFDPERDMLGATYKPVKSDSGDYIYDVFEQLYRPFRNWSVEEKRNPVTFELDEDKGVYGDVTRHPIKAFDGHIGTWEETPTRYNMIRLREDPINTQNEDGSLKYNYLTREIKVGETGHYDGENYDYTVTYPAGYQTDSYVQDNDGPYVLASDVRQPKRPDLFIKLFGKDAYWHLLGGSDLKEEKDTYQISDKETKTIWQKIADWFEQKFNKDEDITDEVYENSDSALLISNGEKGSEYYDEDEESVVMYAIGDQLIFVPKVSSLANQSETKNALDKELIDKTKTENETAIEAKDRYIKYKPWYWRHWKAGIIDLKTKKNKRYNFNPKICVQKTVNGLTVFKPFNKVEDQMSDDYRVIERDVDGTFKNERDEDIAFYLLKPKRQFRSARELDYGTRKYRMELQDKKKKEYWVESPNGEAYLRHYKTGDGEIKLWDGHFGRWIDCFYANERPTEEKIDKLSGWHLDNPDYPGLAVSYKKNDKGELTNEVDMAILPEYYLAYGDIMIPWDARVLNRDKKFTRQRVPYSEEKHNELYVNSDGVYMTLEDYYNDNGFIEKLDYSGLKVSFITDFKYDATNFSIKDLPENRDEYLSFNLNNDPDGQIDLVISKKDDNEIKERWIYWIGTVNKQFSLTENPLQTIGMLFETNRQPNAEGIVAPYPFLGMQMFRYIPYEKKEVDTKIEDVTYPIVLKGQSCNNIKEAVIEVYNQLFGYYDGSQTLLNFRDYGYIKQALQVTPQYAAMVSKLFSEYGYVWDIDRPEKLEKVETTPIKIPLFPGEPPDARDLFRTLYYIYDPEKVTDVDDVVYEYVGTEPIYDPVSNPNGMFKIAYDELCQKVRSIKGKESNYFKLLQDCCDTFDCWLDPIIEHDDQGRVKYIEKPVYIENKLNNDEEPQLYIGQDAKERALDKKIAWYLKRFGYGTENSRIELVKDETTKEPIHPLEYKAKTNAELDDDQLLELRELNRLSRIVENLTIRYILVPDKKIRFRRYVGQENWNGFKYGVNLKHIKRTVDSNQISTRVIVKPNNNEHAKDNFCTIQRAHDNPIKENFLYDFSYYTQQGLLDKKELNDDLYTNIRSRLNYYNELGRLNKDNDKIIEELSTLLVDLDEVTANYETAVLKRDAAIEEIQKAALTLTSSYDTYGQILDTPWTPNKSQEYITRKQTSAPATSFETSVKLSTGEDFNIVIDMPKTATAVDYPKYNDALRSLLDNMDIYQEEYEQSIADIEKYEPEKKRIEADIAYYQEKQRIIVDKKNELNKLFYHKYSRFIQEGSWVDENYIDDNLYYLDALSVIRTSCKPKITYDIGVVDIAAAVEYEDDKSILESELGDRTYVEDVEFFGYKDDGTTPYWEMVVVSEKVYNLEDPSQNQTKVKNYSTQFDDLFQRIAATSQTLQFNEGSYNRAASIVNENGTLDADLLQKSIGEIDSMAWSNNENVRSDTSGITIENSENANVIRLMSRGIILSTDGGSTWKTAITGNGINADLLTTGRLDTKMLLIGSSDNPNFFWNELGLSAFRINNTKIDYSSFVRLDQYGIYGIQDYDVKDKTQLSLNDTFAPRSVKEISNNPNAVFGLTWDGFFLNASNGTGRVTIGTEQDFKMSEFSDKQNAWMDKVIIGRLSDNNGNEYYGFRLKNNENQIVMETNDSGELYLKRKLRISNFNEGSTYDTLIYSNEEITVKGISYKEYYKKYTTNERGENYVHYYTLDNFETPFHSEINTDVDWRELVYDPQDRVTLGIVDVYNREQGFEKVATPKGIYSSSEYLTKVFSAKANVKVGLEQFNDEDISKVIEKNENFAIFDNGNLFARNAWIEGHIRATSGTIGGIEITTESLQSVDYDRFTNKGWRITKDGSAIFKSGSFTGALQAQSGNITGILLVGTDDEDKNNLVKIGRVATYDNSVTKVLSVSATETEENSIEKLSDYIDSTEAFALFDNGLLYAKNAYIEGHITATSGSFTGDIYAGGGTIGKIKISDYGIESTDYSYENSIGWRINPTGNAIFNNIEARGGTIGGIDITPTYIGTGINSSETNGWTISSDGTATFRNVNVSGKITSTIFEYDKVQTVAGSMLIRPAVYFKSYEVDNNVLYIIVDSDSIPSEFAVNSLVKFGNSFTDNCVIYKISSIDTANKKLGLTPTSGSISEDTSYTTQNIILHMGGAEEKVIGLGLNASINPAVLPAQSFSIIELGVTPQGSEDTYKTRAILGKIPGKVVAAFHNAASADGYSDTYGLYADEVYLTGEIHATAGNIGDIIIAKEGLRANGQQRSWEILADGTAKFVNGEFSGIITAFDGGKIGDIDIVNGGIQFISERYDNEGWEIRADGTVSFSSGVFEGEIVAKSGLIGQILIAEGGLTSHYSNKSGWKINSNGDTYLNNLFLSGNAILFPASIITSVGVSSIDEEQNKFLTTIYFETEDANIDEIIDALENNDELEIYFSSFDTRYRYGSKYTVTTAGIDNQNRNFVQIKTPEALQIQQNDTFFLMPIRDGLNNLGIVLNADDSSIYPKRSISIVDLINPSKDNTKLVLGYLDSSLFNENVAKVMGGTYGLYSDNVYLKGSIISETGEYYAGITTNRLITNINNQPLADNIIFFAGTGMTVENLKFYVTETGRMFAEDGYFKGIIEASEIRGNGAGKDTPGLLFRDVADAIHFVQTGQNGQKDQPIFKLSTTQAAFYKDNLRLLNISMNENPSLKMYETKINNSTEYLFSIEKTDANEVVFKYKNKEVITLNEDGAKVGNGNSSIGENAYFEDAIVTTTNSGTTTNTYIGCNIVLI